MSSHSQLRWTYVSLLSVFFALTTLSIAEEGNLTDKLRNATGEVASDTHLLQYKYQPGEEIQYEVEHLATVDTTIAGNNQQTKLRTRSQRSIDVKDVLEDGSMKFVHTVKSVNMWSEVAGRKPIRYDSTSGDPPPAGYEQFAESVGKPLSTIVMTPAGKIIDRQDTIQHPNLGLGGLSIPLPENAIPVGYKWAKPFDMKVRLQDERIKVVKTRQLYELKNVSAGIATIHVKTQVLTPINNPRVKSQIMQRISAGKIRFDIDAGRLLSQQLDWDESVLGFSGAESNMKYLARFTEKLIESDRTASRVDEPASSTQ